MKDAFCVSDARWHDQVTARFDQVMEQLVEAIAKDQG
jgi:hypothetical protein